MGQIAHISASARPHRLPSEPRRRDSTAATHTSGRQEMATVMTDQRAASGEQLWQLSAGELAARIARGELSAVEVVEAHIARIEAVNPRLNAIVAPRFDAAR